MRIDTNNFRGNILSLTSEYVLIFEKPTKFVFLLVGNGGEKDECLRYV